MRTTKTILPLSALVCALASGLLTATPADAVANMLGKQDMKERSRTISQQDSARVKRELIQYVTKLGDCSDLPLLSAKAAKDPEFAKQFNNAMRRGGRTPLPASLRKEFPAFAQVYSEQPGGCTTTIKIGSTKGGNSSNSMGFTEIIVGAIVESLIDKALDKLKFEFTIKVSYG